MVWRGRLPPGENHLSGFSPPPQAGTPRNAPKHGKLIGRDTVSLRPWPPAPAYGTAARFKTVSGGNGKLGKTTPVAECPPLTASGIPL